MRFRFSSIVMFGAAALLLFIGWLLYNGREADPSTSATQQAVNEYNALHGVTINGETLTPSSNGYQPVVVEGTPAGVTVDTAVTPVVSSGIAQATLDTSGCITGTIIFMLCDVPVNGVNVCQVVLTGYQESFDVDNSLKATHQPGSSYTACK